MIMKEKRYEIIKRKDKTLKINALGAEESSVNGDILENSSRYQTAAPRSSVQNMQYNELLTKKLKGDPPVSRQKNKK